MTFKYLCVGLERICFLNYEYGGVVMAEEKGTQVDGLSNEGVSELVSSVGSRMRKLDEFKGNIEKLDKSRARKIEELNKDFEKYKKPHSTMLTAVFLEVFGFIDDHIMAHSIMEQKTFEFKAGTVVYGQDKFTVLLHKSKNHDEEVIMTESIRRLRRLRKKEARRKAPAE